MQAHAGLQTIGTATYGISDYNLIYDNDAQLTWLDYSNAKNLWDNQRSWASGLNGAGVLTYNLNAGITMNWSADWRLPSTVDGPKVIGVDGTTTAGYNITSSELGHLFYTELGNIGLYATDGTYAPPGYGLSNTGDFQNLQDGYWSGMENSANPTFAWYFNNSWGLQNTVTKGASIQGIAVRSGQLAAVPEPTSLLLLGSGLVGMLGLKRRFRK